MPLMKNLTLLMKMDINTTNQEDDKKKIELTHSNLSIRFLYRCMAQKKYLVISKF